MAKNIAADGTGDPYPGVRKYLQAGSEERKAWNRSDYNKRAREAAIWALDFLTLFSERQTDPELLQVLGGDRFPKLFNALLNRRKPKIQRGKSANFWEELNEGKDCRAMIEREYQIAYLVAEIGVRKCLERMAIPSTTTQGVRMINPVHQRTSEDAEALLATLGFAVNSRLLDPEQEKK